MPVIANAFDNDCSSEQAKSLLELARLTFDFVLVDCPSEANNLFAAWSLNKADKVLLCLGGCPSCALWHKANDKALQAVRSKTVYISSEVTQDFDYSAMHELLACKPDVRIPYMRDAALMQSKGRFLFGRPGKGRAYSSAINQLYEVMQP